MSEEEDEIFFRYSDRVFFFLIYSFRIRWFICLNFPQTFVQIILFLKPQCFIINTKMLTIFSLCARNIQDKLPVKLDVLIRILKHLIKSRLTMRLLDKHVIFKAVREISYPKVLFVEKDG
jgi:hypothetical protein